MKIKLDENLPADLAPELTRVGHDVHTVPDERLGGRPDQDIFAAAQREGRFLVTQDLDLADIRRFAPGTHAGILVVRLHVPGRRQLMERTLALFRSEAAAEWGGCFVVATEQKVRVRRAGM